MSDGWTLVYEGFDPLKEGLREALCTLGNGVFATRGAAEEAEADEVHYPGTYLAGGYNRRQTQLAGKLVENEDLVNLPNWLPLRFRPADGHWINLLRVEVLAFRQSLDLRCGLLIREAHVRDTHGRETRLTSRRLVHMREPGLAAIELTVTPLNWSGQAEILSALDGRVINAGVERYRQFDGQHLSPLDAWGEGYEMVLVSETNQSRLRIALAARTRLAAESELSPTGAVNAGEDNVSTTFTFDVGQGQAITIEKTVALFTSRSRAISEPRDAALAAVREAGDFETLLDSHAEMWRVLWDRFDLRIADSTPAQLALRLHIFHLLQTVSPNTIDLDAGVPARGLHGEAYRGHIFWDELFILPFLSFRMPELARSLMLYRYRRLPEARRLARAAGFDGAMFPWQSGSSGREESQVLHLNPRSGRWTEDNTHLQRHVSSAIAYNVWRYWQATGDDSFLSFYGAEMLVEIARFWASIVRHDPGSDRYCIHGVMGADEFHDAYPWRNAPGIDDNAYTNVMAAWVLCRAADALDMLDPDRRSELVRLLEIAPEEPQRWRQIGRRMRVPFLDNGLIAQFAGYGRLNELDWQAYRDKYGDIQRLDRILEAEGDTTNRYKASKQADVLMLFYLFSSDELRDLFDLLGYDFDPASIPRTIDYYMQRTSDGSTLSRVVHAWVLARSDRPKAWALLEKALGSDLEDIQGGTTAEGIHLGAMVGTVDMVQRGLMAVEFRDDLLCLSPWLPEGLRELHLKLLHHGQWLRFDIDERTFEVRVPANWAGPKRLGLRNAIYPIEPGRSLRFECSAADGGWRPVPAPERAVLSDASGSA